MKKLKDLKFPSLEKTELENILGGWECPHCNPYYPGGCDPNHASDWNWCENP